MSHRPTPHLQFLPRLSRKRYTIPGAKLKLSGGVSLPSTYRNNASGTPLPCRDAECESNRATITRAPGRVCEGVLRSSRSPTPSRKVPTSYKRVMAPSTSTSRAATYQQSSFVVEIEPEPRILRSSSTRLALVTPLRPIHNTATPLAMVKDTRTAQTVRFVTQAPYIHLSLPRAIGLPLRFGPQALEATFE